MDIVSDCSEIYHEVWRLLVTEYVDKCVIVVAVDDFNMKYVIREKYLKDSVIEVRLMYYCLYWSGTQSPSVWCSVRIKHRRITIVVIRKTCDLHSRFCNAIVTGCASIIRYYILLSCRAF
jgi:hypothetical protein